MGSFYFREIYKRYNEGVIDMKFIDRLKLKYHMFKVIRAMEKGNKDQYSFYL